VKVYLNMSHIFVFADAYRVEEAKKCYLQGSNQDQDYFFIELGAVPKTEGSTGLFKIHLSPLETFDLLALHGYTVLACGSRERSHSHDFMWTLRK